MTGRPTSLAHWGAFSADVRDGDIASVHPVAGDADPSPLLGNLPGSLRHSSRIAGPAVRRGWLDPVPDGLPARGEAKHAPGSRGDDVTGDGIAGGGIAGGVVTGGPARTGRNTGRRSGRSR